MTMFRNLLGDVADPFFIECIQRGRLVDAASAETEVLNVYHFHRLSNSLAFDPADIADVLRLQLSAPIIAVTNARYIIDQWECRAIDDPAAATGVAPDSDVGAVGTAATSYVGFAAAKFTIRSGHRGRSFNGSKHFAGLDESHVTEDRLNAAGLTAWGGVTTALQDMVGSGLLDSAGNAWIPFVLSRTLSSLGPTDIPAVITGANWETVTLNPIVGSMTRRKENVGS